MSFQCRRFLGGRLSESQTKFKKNRINDYKALCIPQDVNPVI